MKIFIDESGIFSQLKESDNINNGWATIAALAVPNKSELELEKALNELKASLHMTSEEEIKQGRPDCSSPTFAEFVNKVKKLQCTLYAVVINRQTINDKIAIELKSQLIEGKKNYCKIMSTINEPEKQRELMSEADTEFEMISSLSNAEFIQMRTQAYLYTFMLFNAITYYAKHAPEELQKLAFINDKKNPSYEIPFCKLFPGYINAELSKTPASMMGSKEFNYSYFIDSYGINPEESNVSNDLESKRKMYGVDYSKAKHVTRAGYDILKVFEDVRFENSKHSVGLQVVDLLVSNINRTFKGFCDSIDIQAEILGGITVNTPRVSLPNIPVLIFDGSLLKNAEIEFEALEKMSKFSYPLYNEVFRENFSKNFAALQEMVKMH